MDEQPITQDTIDALRDLARAIDRLCNILEDAFGDELPPRDAMPSNEYGRCARCNGTGALGDGTYCSCKLGRDLERVESGRLKEPA
jgi:hypothetical protein